MKSWFPSPDRSPPSAVRLAAFVLGLCVLLPTGLRAAPGQYEPGIDPGLGFNLVSWNNFSNGAQVWENAVQSVFDSGFSEVSLSPVRYFTPGVGSIAASSSSGPELSHIAAGVARAKQLGMRVTVNPFVEPVGFSDWRGFYDPTPGSAESSQFWSDYQQYLSEVATVAQTGGADAMTVGTELRALSRNAGNNSQWKSLINSVDSQFSGSIGYAANWDNYNNPNVALAIWDHPAIDYLGIDSYFQGLLSNAQADASGGYPNPAFISQVEAAWNAKLDDEILPFAAARQSGSGLPVEFTEVGYLPFNRTSRTPQNSSGVMDADEQNMAFEGLMRALDGRLASGELLAAHIWQWDMPGSGGSHWNLNPAGGNQPSNQQTAQWLSSFVKGTNQNPVDPPPATATQVLYSFENGLEGFSYPNYETQPASVLSQASGTGATDGVHSLAIAKPTSAWTWDARVQMSDDQLQALQQALNDDADDYVLTIDVTYAASDLPAGLTDLNMHVSLETDLDGWQQVFPFAEINAPTDQTFAVEVPLSAFELSGGIASASLHLGFVGNFTGAATIYVDRIALTNTSFPLAGDYNSDGVIDSADYTVWRDSLGQSVPAGSGADGNANGMIDQADYMLWREHFGQSVTTTSPAVSPASSSVPEPTAMVILAILCVLACAAQTTRVAGAR